MHAHKKYLYVRDAEENQRAEHRDGNKKEKNGEEKSLEQATESTECGGKLLLLATGTLYFSGDLSHLLLHLFKLFALAFDARAQPTAFVLHFAEMAVERGEIGTRLDGGFADGYAGEDRQQFCGIG